MQLYCDNVKQESQGGLMIRVEQAEDLSSYIDDPVKKVLQLSSNPFAHIKRNESGQWLKGQTGNPAGRLSEGMRILKEGQRIIGEESLNRIDKLFYWIDYYLNPHNEATGRERFEAMKFIADRAAGRPVTPIDIKGSKDDDASILTFPELHERMEAVRYIIDVEKEKASE